MKKDMYVVVAILSAIAAGAFAQSEPAVQEPHRPIFGCLVEDRLTVSVLPFNPFLEKTK